MTDETKKPKGVADSEPHDFQAQTPAKPSGRTLKIRKIGNSLGKPGLRELQKKVLRDALSQLTGPAHPGEVIEQEYPEYGS